jgi:hypothetical protein
LGRRIGWLAAESVLVGSDEPGYIQSFVRRKSSARKSLSRAKQKRAYVHDFSAGTQANLPMYENYKAAMRLSLPTLVRIGVVRKPEGEQLYEQMLSAILWDGFRAFLSSQCLWICPR